MTSFFLGFSAIIAALQVLIIPSHREGLVTARALRPDALTSAVRFEDNSPLKAGGEKTALAGWQPNAFYFFALT